MTAKEQVAEALGIDAEKIKRVEFELSVLRKQGLLIDLNISGTSMFSRKANWSDIGIQEDENDPRFNRFTTGQKYLISEKQIKKLRSVETRMRQWLERLSFDITGFKPYRWLPYSAYEKWCEKWSELTNEFYQVKAEILEEYDSYFEDLSDTFSKIAEASWRAIKAQGYEWFIMDGKVYNHDDFVRMVISNATSKMPSKEDIEQKLKADYVTALVYSQEDIAADKAAAEKIRIQMELERARADAQKREAYLQAEILQEQYNHQRRMQQLEEQERVLRIEAMFRAEAEHYRDQLQEIVSPFEQVFTNLRQWIAESAIEMLESIRKNGHVRGKVAERGLGLVKTFELLAIHDDRELLNAIRELEKAIGAVGEDRPKDAPARDPNAVIAALEDIQRLANRAKSDFLAGPSRFVNLDR